jgi:hypothetical protein
VVTVIGLIDGNDVLGLIPINPADNVLHILLTIAALAAGLSSDRDRRDVRHAAERRRFERASRTESPTLQRR